MNEVLTDPKVFTIPGSHSFVDSLAKGIRAQIDDAPETLSKITILLPTRRACRAFREAILRENDGTPVLLPKLLPLGDIDEDELQIGESELIDEATGSDYAATMTIPPPIPRMHRLILLTRLILAKPGSSVSPDQAANLAYELGRLLDQIHTEKLSFDRLHDLVPDDFATHWQITLDFLTILTDAWPKLLAAEGFLDPTEYRNRLLEKRANIWKSSPPQEPVIAAGSTGSIPATADLLSVIARLPKGAVILPGLDLDMDDKTWDLLEPTHPQFSMSKLLKHMNVSRSKVTNWPTQISHSDSTREFFINAMLAPAATKQPIIDQNILDKAMEGILRLDCPGPREEATAIALMLREILETPGQTAALVTPDRNLARRVAAELRRWQIEIDDSAGKALDKTIPGSFLRLIADAAANNLAPINLLALLKHPCTSIGYPPTTFRNLARRLESTALRGPRPNEGIEGLRKALPKDEHNLNTFLNKIANALNPLLSIPINEKFSLSEMMQRLVRCAESLTSSDTLLSQEQLWIDEAGEETAGFVSEILEWGHALEIEPNRFAALLETLMANRVARSRHVAHPRLAILGTLEARLQSRDLLILGGLNEGTWPPQTPASPWMSRPMMLKFGLPLPERRVGLSAHDFAQGLNARKVTLTRAERVDGTPTVPCRWLRRIDNFLIRMQKPEKLTIPGPWLKWIAAADEPSALEIIAAPRPMPPTEVRPQSLSVTEVETLIRDPYAIYARRILGLKPMDVIDADPGAAERGNIIHKILEEFITKYPDNLPGDAEEMLLNIGKQHFESHITRPGIRAFWWPRFKRIASWFVINEQRQRKIGRLPLALEIKGNRTFFSNGKTFTLTARADRIDINSDGTLSIIDYKTGKPPSDKQIAVGLTPQLPLEAAIANKGGFEEVCSETVSNLIYIQLSGGRRPGHERPIKLNVAQTIEDAVSGLIRLVKKYENPATPYLSQPRPMFASQFGIYDHLARLKEWQGRRKKL